VNAVLVRASSRAPERARHKQAALAPLTLSRDGAAVLAASLVLYLAMIWAVVFHLNILVTDAMARTVDAWQVFFSADPKITHVGFIWAPLPTLLQLPLVLIPPLRTTGLSGNLLTALAGALTCLGLLSGLEALGVGRRTRLMMTAVFALNPMMLFYAANGMSEMTSTALTVWSVAFLARWGSSRHPFWLTLSAFSLALACLARYDSLIQAALMAVVIPYLLGGRRTHREERQALTLAYLMPVAAAMLLWVVMNLLIMGDPLHFARGEYSNAAQIGYQMSALPQIARLMGNPPAIATFLAQRITMFFPAFSVGLVLAVLVGRHRRSRLGFGLATLALTFPAFQVLNLFAGQSAAFLRYFILAIPFGVLLVGYALPRAPIPARLASLGAVALLLGSNGSTLLAMQQATEWGQWNDVFVRALLTGKPEQTWTTERQIAEYLAQQPRGRDILVDDFQGYRIIFFSGHPEWFVATGDSDFELALEEPVGRVRYVLVSPPHLEGTLNRVNQAYPTLYSHGAEWATLEREWLDLLGSTWRLYRVSDLPRR